MQLFKISSMKQHITISNTGQQIKDLIKEKHFSMRVGFALMGLLFNSGLQTIALYKQLNPLKFITLSAHSTIESYIIERSKGIANGFALPLLLNIDFSTIINVKTFLGQYLAQALNHLELQWNTTYNNSMNLIEEKCKINITENIFKMSSTSLDDYLMAWLNQEFEKESCINTSVVYSRKKYRVILNTINSILNQNTVAAGEFLGTELARVENYFTSDNFSGITDDKKAWIKYIIGWGHSIIGYTAPLYYFGSTMLSVRNTILSKIPIFISVYALLTGQEYQTIALESIAFATQMTPPEKPICPENPSALEQKKFNKQFKHYQKDLNNYLSSLSTGKQKKKKKGSKEDKNSDLIISVLTAFISGYNQAIDSNKDSVMYSAYAEFKSEFDNAIGIIDKAKVTYNTTYNLIKNSSAFVANIMPISWNIASKKSAVEFNDTQEKLPHHIQLIGASKKVPANNSNIQPKPIMAPIEKSQLFAALMIEGSIKNDLLTTGLRMLVSSAQYLSAGINSLNNLSNAGIITASEDIGKTFAYCIKHNINLSK